MLPETLTSGFRGKLTIGMLAGLLAGPGPALAQSVGGATVTQFQQGTTVQSGACTASGSATLSGLCDVPGGFGGQVTTYASFTAPTAFDPNNPGAYQLASLGTAATSTINVYSLAGPTPRPAALPGGVTTYAYASYRDFLELGDQRPASLTLSFELSGQLGVVPPPAGSSGFDAAISYSVSAQSGTLYPAAGGIPASFGSFAPYGYGVVNSRTAWSTGTSVTIDSNAAGGFSHTTSVISPELRIVTVTLGAPYFSNAANNQILLDISLAAEANSPSVAFDFIGFGETRIASATSLFDSTFKMVGLTAYDELGNDITGSAIVGFASLQPVPEPEVATMLLAGLALTVFLSRRRRKRAG